MRGFSLLEVIIAITLLTLLAMITFPSLIQFSTAAVDKLSQTYYANALQFAEDVAYSKHVPVSICKSNNQHTCQGEWQDGLLIFVDPDNTGQIQNPKQIIKTLSFQSKASTFITWHAFHYHYTHIHFTPDNHLDNAGALIAYRDKQIIWQITLNRAGSVRMNHQQASLF